MCSGIKVTCSFMMNCHAIIRINVCNWFTHLQPEWQTTCHIDDSIFSVMCMQMTFFHSVLLNCQSSDRLPTAADAVLYSSV